MNNVDCVWQGDMKFLSHIGDYEITIDASKEFGGSGAGPTPKPLILTALAGCTSMDVVSMMKKMKVDFDYFNVRVSAELSDDHPKTYTEFNIIYEINCPDNQLEKVEKAVKLSQEKYCGVSAMLKKVSELKWKIVKKGA